LKKTTDPLETSFYALSSLLLLSPTVHFWYVAWVILFLPLFTRPTLIWASLLFVLWFSADMMYLKTARWYQPLGVYFIIWGGIYLSLFYEIISASSKKNDKKISAQNFRPPRSISVIIPTLNAGDTIENCLSSIKKSSVLAKEILVIDGGSEDDTVAISKNMGAAVCFSDKSRGKQIKTGFSRASGDVCFIVHSDAVVQTNTIRKIYNAFKNNNDLIGGAVGQYFIKKSNEPALGLTFIEVLNDIKTTLAGISFGDQGQFLRRDFALKKEIIPSYPLMEDVETALGMKRYGKIAYLWSGLGVSPVKWQKGFFSRFFMVLGLLVVFFIRRRRKEYHTVDLYEKYYEKHYRKKPLLVKTEV